MLNNRLDWLPPGYSDIMQALNRLGRVWRDGIVEVATRDWNGSW